MENDKVEWRKPWSLLKEQDRPPFPCAELFDSLECFAETRLKADVLEWTGGG